MKRCDVMGLWADYHFKLHVSEDEDVCIEHEMVQPWVIADLTANMPISVTYTTATLEDGTRYWMAHLDWIE